MSTAECEGEYKRVDRLLPFGGKNVVVSSSLTPTTSDVPSVKVVDKVKAIDPLDPLNFIERVKVEVAGAIIRACDVMKTLKTSNVCTLSTQDKTGSVYEVGVYATTQFVMDEDTVLPGVNLAILAPSWSIEGNKVIDLSGRNGRTQEKPATPETPDKSTIAPSAGVDGKAGHPGESSGNLMIFGLSDKDASKLTIKLNGGDGGDGQDAGDGARSADVIPEAMPVDPETGEVGNYPDGSSGWQREYIMGHSMPTTKRFWKVTEKTYALRGASSGGRGAGGLPGEAGILLSSGPRIVPIQSKGSPGSAGRPGQPGKGGKGYNRVVRVVMLKFNVIRHMIVHNLVPPPIQRSVDISRLPRFTSEERLDEIDAKYADDGEQITELSHHKPNSPAPPIHIRTWKYIISFLLERRKAQREKENRKLGKKNDEEAVETHDGIAQDETQNQVDASHGDVEVARQLADLFAVKSLPEVSEIIYHLTIAELSGLCKQALLLLWQTFEKALVEYIENEEDEKIQDRACIILRAVMRKVGYAMPPLNGLDSVGPAIFNSDYPYVWNLEGFRQLLELRVSALEDYKSVTYLSKQKEAYAKSVDEKIEASKRDANELSGLLDKAIEDIDAQLLSIFNQVEDLIQDTKRNIGEIKKQIEQYNKLVILKSVFSSFKVVVSVASVACPAFAPVGGLVSTLMDVGSTIGENVIKPQSLPIINIKVPAFKFKDTFGFCPDEELTATKSQLKILKEAKTQEEFNEAKHRLTHALDRERKKRIAQVGFIRRTEARQLAETLRQLHWDQRDKDIPALEADVAKKEKVLADKVKNWETSANAVKALADGGLEVYNAAKNLEKEKDSVEAKKASLEKDLKKLKDTLGDIDKARQCAATIGKDLNIEIESYANRSFSELIGSSTKFINTLKQFSAQFKKQQDCLKVEPVYESIETAIAMYSGIADIYKHIAQYNDHKEFAGYIADLHNEGKDEDIIKATAQLEANYLLTQHRSIVTAIKTHLAISHLQSCDDFDVLNPDKLVEFLEKNKVFIQEQYLPLLANALSDVQRIIKEDNSFLVTKDSMIKPGYVHKTAPFTFSDSPIMLEKLMKGETIELSLHASSCKWNLFAATNVRLHIEHKDATLDSRLQSYLGEGMEAVLRKFGCSQFRIEDSYYDAPFSCPPTLTHTMDGAKCNGTLKKLKDQNASPAMSPFGGQWEIRLKCINQADTVDLLGLSVLKYLYHPDNPPTDTTDFLKGVTFYLEFVGQCIDFYVDEHSKKKLPFMKRLIAQLQA